MPRIIYRNKEGTILPGVTTVLDNLGWSKRGLMHWAWKQGWEQKDYREESKAAATVGTLAHKMVELELRMGAFTLEDLTMFRQDYPWDLVDKALVAYEAWVNWRDLVGFELVASEHAMVSEKLQTGGCLDVALVQNTMGITDLKATNDIYLEHRIQNCVYGAIWNELNPDKQVEGLYWLKLGKEEPSFTYEFMPFDSDKVRLAIETFKHIRAIHEAHKELKKWK